MRCSPKMQAHKTTTSMAIEVRPAPDIFASTIPLPSYFADRGGNEQSVCQKLVSFTLNHIRKRKCDTWWTPAPNVHKTATPLVAAQTRELASMTHGARSF